MAATLVSSGGHGALRENRLTVTLRTNSPWRGARRDRAHGMYDTVGQRQWRRRDRPPKNLQELPRQGR